MSIELASPVTQSHALSLMADSPATPAIGPAAAPAASDQRVSYPNPASRLDPALHIVILEFRDASGRITESLPTAQQLQQFKQQSLTAAPEASAQRAQAVTKESKPDTAAAPAQSPTSATTPTPRPTPVEAETPPPPLPPSTKTLSKWG